MWWLSGLDNITYTNQRHPGCHGNWHSNEIAMTFFPCLLWPMVVQNAVMTHVISFDNDSLTKMPWSQTYGVLFSSKLHRLWHKQHPIQTHQWNCNYSVLVLDLTNGFQHLDLVHDIFTKQLYLLCWSICSCRVSALLVICSGVACHMSTFTYTGQTWPVVLVSAIRMVLLLFSYFTRGRSGRAASLHSTVDSLDDSAVATLDDGRLTSLNDSMLASLDSCKVTLLGNIMYKMRKRAVSPYLLARVKPAIASFRHGGSILKVATAKQYL